MNNIRQSVIGITTAISLFAGSQVLADESPKQLVVDLLEKGLVQGDTKFIQEHVDENYIQHNPQAPDGLEGLLGFVGYLGTLKEPISIKPIRVLQEGDLIVVHGEYSMDGPKAVFDLFRVVDGKIVEHWDAIQEIPVSTVSGRSMTDGPTIIKDRELTVVNKQLVSEFVTDILIDGKGEKLTDYIGEKYHQHNPNVDDGLKGLGEFLGYLAENNISFFYKTLHRVVAEGNFVFTQSEGEIGGASTAFYDLFRVEGGQIVEHWDVVQQIPAEFAHENGMF